MKKTVTLQAQLVPECCLMRNLDWNQLAAGSSSISEKYQGEENASSAVRSLRPRDQRSLTCAKLIRDFCNRHLESCNILFQTWLETHACDPSDYMETRLKNCVLSTRLLSCILLRVHSILTSFISPLLICCNQQLFINWFG